MTWFLFALLAAVALSTESIIDKGVLRKENPNTFAALVMITSGLISLPFLWIVDWSKITLIAFAWIFLAVLVVSAAFLLWARSMKRMQISVMAPMSTLTPAVVALLGALLLGEFLTGIQIAGLALLIVGGYCLQLKRGQDWFYPVQLMWQSRDFHVLLASFTLYPISSIMARYAYTRLQIPPYDYLVLVRIMAGTLFAFYLAMNGGLGQVVKHLPRYKGAIFWIALLDMISAGAVGLALAGAYAVKALAVVRLSALFTTVIGGEVFHERNILKKACACLVMLMGVLAISLG